MSKKKKILPELRFPEFDGDGEWKTNSLGNLAEIKGRIGYRGYTREDIVEKGKGAITLSPSNFEENGSLNFEKSTYITWEKYEESPEIKLEEGQTVIVKTASVGKSAYVQKLPEKATINPQIVVLKPQKIEPKFLAYSIFHNYVQNQIKGAVGAGAIPNMSQDSISKFDILLPPDKKGNEQQKIASCLSSLDEVIAAHSQKLELLKDHKKGLMQNLFPQEGEKVPKLRFKEFEKDGEWVEKVIGDFIESHKGGAPLTPSDFETNSNYEVIPKKAIGKGMWLKIETPTYCSEKFYNDNGQSLVDNTYLITTLRDLVPSGPNIGYIVKYKTEKKYILAQGVYGLKIKENLFPDFLIHFSNTKIYRKLVNSIMVGSTQVHIRNGEFFKLPIYVPQDFKEQQKISSCLSSLDELITKETEKIEQLKQHKKGLMQGLFPKIEN